MSRFGAHYQVARATGRCAATERSLEPGDSCIATLCEREEDDGLDRLDFSIEAWDAGARPERLFSHWRTVVPEPDARRRLLVDDDVLMDLFERLADDERPQRIAFRFVLALVLLRKRLLRFAGRAVQADGSERWLLRPRGAASDERPFELLNPKLDEEDVRELTAQLGEILQGEL